MRRKSKNTALKAVFIYLLLSGGSWMFINCYANSYNRLSGEDIRPAGAVISGGQASVELLDHSAQFSISGIAPESKAYCGAYLLSPDEVRAAAYVISLCI
jgi:hypothetical protein